MTITLEEYDPQNHPQSHVKQAFYFKNNADLLLNMLDNKEKTSRAQYIADNSLDKNVPTFNLTENRASSNERDTLESGREGGNADIFEKDELPASFKTGRLENEYNIVDVDELYDKIFELYDAYKEIKKNYSEKYGRSFFMKNEHTILEKILKKDSETKNVLLRRFENLSYIYKDRNIRVNKNDPLCRLKKNYDAEVERIYGMSQVESYKEYIRYVFLAIELIANYMGFDMTGYTKFQTERIDKYERILTEIGSIPSLTKLNTMNPIAKLALLFLFNTICFVGIKVAIKKDKSGGLIFNSIASVIGNCFAGGGPQTTGGAPLSHPFGFGANGASNANAPTQSQPQARMRGPTID